LDSLVDTKWNALLATKLEVPDVNVAKEFVVGASILERKWQDRVAHYDSFHEQALSIVPELGPSFEGPQQNNRRLTHKSKIVVRACWALHFEDHPVLQEL
jgi:hypothetical protein